MSFQDYARPYREQWQSAGIIQFGAAGETVAYARKGPPGKKGLVRDIMVVITESMVGTTAVPEINVGAAASTNNGTTAVPSVTYARFRLGTAAGTGYTTSTFTSGVVRARGLVTGNGGAALTYSDFTGHVSLETALLPADTVYFISLLEGLDGTEAGAGYVQVDIDWF